MNSKFNDKRKILIIVGIILSVLLASAGTYALWLWTSNIDKNLVMNTITGLNDYIIYDDGDSKFVGNFQPTDKFCQSEYNTISFYKTGELIGLDVDATIYLQVENIGENIAASSDVYWVLTEGDNTVNCDDLLNSSSVISYGNFNGFEVGNSIELLSDVSVKNIEKKYTIWIWIDNSSDNLSSLSGETIYTTVWTQFEVLGKSKYVVSLDANGGMLDNVIELDSNTYTSPGSYTFTALYNADYKVELWGASGGGSSYGGKAAYTSGNLNLNKNEKLYFYVGGKGTSNSTLTNVGGYNGGGYSGNNTGRYSYSGGGATDVRLKDGLWNDELGLKSRIMVAAGGAGSVDNMTVAAAYGGGLIGGKATSSNSTYNASTYLADGSTQTGTGFSYQGTRGGSFGYAMQTHHTGWGGGGSGGYYGGNTGYGGNGAGGSSFISGHTGCVAIESSTSVAARTGTNSAVCTTGIDDNLCSVHYSRKVFTDTVMIDGSGYLWTNEKYALKEMPNPSGGTYASGVGHVGDGAAKIYIENAIIVKYGDKYNDLPEPTRDGYIFAGWYTESNGGVLVTNNSYLASNDSHTLYARWLSPSYIINLDANTGDLDYSTLVDSYSASGSYTFIAPYSMDYKIELWGASGGARVTGYQGFGAYTSGMISLNEKETLYLFVGGVGPSNASVTNVGGYNGGGYSGNNATSNSYGGGGATDVRLVNETWNNTTSLRSRIMVAAGGAGTSASLTTIAGEGGGLKGGNGTSSSDNYNNSTYIPGGATQTGAGYSVVSNKAGKFGYAVQSNYTGWGGGGGGGYYGGNTGNGTTGSGGSSFISGHTGCVAVKSSTSSSARTGTDSASCATGNSDNLCSIHYSGKVFTNTVMIDGKGYNWTNAKGDLSLMPNPSGGTYGSGEGHFGDGAVRISMVNKILVASGGVYGTLPTPTKDGYTFLGWYTDPEVGTLVTGDTTLISEQDHTLYAHWQAN